MILSHLDESCFPLSTGDEAVEGDGRPEEGSGGR